MLLDCRLAGGKPNPRDSTNFWFISEETWTRHLRNAESDDVRTKLSAPAALRRIDGAGRILETEIGITVPRPCLQCIRYRRPHQCKVFSQRDALSCAYCRPKSESDCKANERTTSRRRTQGDRAVDSSRVRQSRTKRWWPRWSGKGL